jgi:hypothetical protein
MREKKYNIYSTVISRYSFELSRVTVNIVHDYSFVNKLSEDSQLPETKPD